MADKVVNRKTKRRRARRRRGLYSVITVIVVLVALVLAVNFLFRVEVIEVIGAERYTLNEVAQASGITSGKCMYLINKFTVAENIAEKLPYVEDVDIYRKLPRTIVIEITERKPSVMVKYGADYWMLDEEGRALDKVTSLSQLGSATTVIGVEPLDVKRGEIIAVSDEQEKNFELLKTVLKALSDEDLSGVFDTIDVSDTGSVVCSYDDGRVSVKFGDCTEMEYRVKFFRAIAAELTEDSTGIIDLTDTKTARFKGA